MTKKSCFYCSSSYCHYNSPPAAFRDLLLIPARMVSAPY